MKNRRLLITTPIYYSNAIPHVGHAYSSFIADVYARFYRMCGYEVRYSTGVDENSQKTVQAAALAGVPIDQYLADLAAQHKAMRDALRISYTMFIRTTQEDHKAFVQDTLSKVYAVHSASGDADIYQGEYTGLYCVGCEGFKKESDLVDGVGDYVGQKVCPDHLKPCDYLSEKNRFFRLSRYQQQLEAFYDEHPHFIQPAHRYNEVKAFTHGGLEDFSISRETNTFGIPLPFDPEHVTYVWFDALLNYITVTRGTGLPPEQATDEQQFRSDAAEKIHVLGKDIVRFHAIYWPAMLLSAGYALPDREIVTGFFTVDGQKMSKSLGNVVNPVDVVNRYGRDALAYYLLSDIQIGSDGDFSRQRFQSLYDTHLIGGWGNLVSRVTNIAAKNNITRGELHTELLGDDFDSILTSSYADATARIKHDFFDTTNIQGYLQLRYSQVQACNELMQRTEPWKLLKNEETRTQAVHTIETLLWLIKQLTILSFPFLLDSAQKVGVILGDVQSIDVGVNPTVEELEAAFERTVIEPKITPGIIYERVEMPVNN